MLLSVIIPTYNRSQILKECLHALYHQDLPEKDYEVVVVDDGSTDDTKRTVQSFKTRHKNLQYHYQRNQGQGIARNFGISKANGDVVIFIGDDIIVVEDFLTEHLRYHLRYSSENEAVLGFTTWHPKLKITRFMSWLTDGSSILGKFGGHQFAYEKLRGKMEADYNFFYTSNISLKRSLVDKYPFDPSFSKYGWEDIELGYRLHKRVNLKLYYNPRAIGYHDHVMTESGLADRMRNIGYSAWIIHRKYPELKKVPSFSKHLVFSILANPMIIFILSLLRKLTRGGFSNIYFYALSKKYFLEGLKNYSQNRF